MSELELRRLVEKGVTVLLRENRRPMLASELLPKLERFGVQLQADKPLPTLAAFIYQTGSFIHYSNGWWFKNELRPVGADGKD